MDMVKEYKERKKEEMQNMLIPLKEDFVQNSYNAFSVASPKSVLLLSIFALLHKAETFII